LGAEVGAAKEGRDAEAAAAAEELAQARGALEGHKR